MEPEFKNYTCWLRCSDTSTTSQIEQIIKDALSAADVDWESVVVEADDIQAL